MPCSGLKSATSLTSFAPNSRSIAVAPSRARPVWLVTSPTRLPLSGAKPCARSTSRPVWTGASAAAAGAARRGAEIASGHQARARRLGGGVGDRRRRDRRDARAERRDVAPAVRMHPVRHEHDERPRQPDRSRSTCR